MEIECNEKEPPKYNSLNKKYEDCQVITSSNWEISNNKRFDECISTVSLIHSPERTSLEDTVSLDTCVALKSCSSGDPCKLEVKIINKQKIARIALASEASVLEFFKQSGEYATTIFAEFVDEFQELSVYFAEAVIQPPSTEVSIKFTRTKNKGTMIWIYGIKLILTESVLENPKKIEKSLLLLILDVNPMQKLVKQVLTQCLDSAIVFSNAHLMQTSNNHIAIMACHSQGAQFLYPQKKMPEVRQFDGQYEKFTQLERTVRQQVHKMIGEMSLDRKCNEESLISGALSMGLCYIARQEREQFADERLYSRILVITASHDSATQYMNYMNIFFTAQKMGIMLDVCSLDHELTLLQQGCDLTGGNYLRIPQQNEQPSLAGLLQYLLWVFLPDPTVRSKLVLPPPVKVDYRAACFCHQELVDTGFVCSICLSIFCKFTPICTTCHTVFKNPAPIPIKLKKKKKNIDLVH